MSLDEFELINLINDTNICMKEEQFNSVFPCLAPCPPSAINTCLLSIAFHNNDRVQSRVFFRDLDRALHPTVPAVLLMLAWRVLAPLAPAN